MTNWSELKEIVEAAKLRGDHLLVDSGVAQQFRDAGLWDDAALLEIKSLPKTSLALLECQTEEDPEAR